MSIGPYPWHLGRIANVTAWWSQLSHLISRPCFLTTHFPTYKYSQGSMSAIDRIGEAVWTWPRSRWSRAESWRCCQAEAEDGWHCCLVEDVRDQDKRSQYYYRDWLDIGIAEMPPHRCEIKPKFSVLDFGFLGLKTQLQILLHLIGLFISNTAGAIVTCKNAPRQTLETLSDLAPPDVTLISCGCLGRCGAGPNLVVLPEAAFIGICGTAARASELMASLCGGGWDPSNNLAALALRKKGRRNWRRGITLKLRFCSLRPSILNLLEVRILFINAGLWNSNVYVLIKNGNY